MKKAICLLITLCASLYTYGQELRPTPNMAVVSLDSKIKGVSHGSLGNITRNELVKLDLFNVFQRYDLEEALANKGIEDAQCFTKSCLLDIGQQVGADIMLSGSVERYSSHIIVSLRTLDVERKAMDLNIVVEYLDLEDHLPSMIGLTLRKMFGLTVDEELLRKLTDAHDYSSSVNVPDVTRLSLSGPRMGLVTILGKDGDILTGDKQSGGYDAWPILTQFGYQFEVSYLNAGSVQALFEFVPMISGLEQGLFIPNVSILHGIRSNISGLEFAFGPIFSLTKKAKGFYYEGQWHLESDEWRPGNEEVFIEKRLDRRGKLNLDTGLVLSVGKSFKSGKVNFPVNIVSVLKKSGIRIGLSFGFNSAN